LNTVLIAGGSGLLGTALTQELLKLGYQVHHLGRKSKPTSGFKTFAWNPAEGKIDLAAFENVTHVINLAGANVGQGRWTGERKKILLESRTKSTQLLIQSFTQLSIKPVKFIQASATGFYGFGPPSEVFMETRSAGNDFLAQLTAEWENSALSLQSPEFPLLIIRIGVVLSKDGGALKVMAQPVKYFAGCPIGSGKQIVPWIHMDDLIQIMLNGVQNSSFTGTYNAVSPQPVDNRTLTRAIGKALRRPVWPIPVPGFLLRMILGEQASVVLKGCHVSSQKLRETGYVFKFTDVQDAVDSLLSKHYLPDNPI